MVVYVKDVGLVVVEVKRSFQELEKGAAQGRRMSDFSAIVFQSCAPTKTLPIVRVVVIGREPPPGSSDDSVSVTTFCRKDEKHDVWILSEKSIQSKDAFHQSWEKILLDLRQTKTQCTSTDGNNKASTGDQEASTDEFKDFVSLMTGIWSMTCLEGKIDYRGKSK